MDTRVLIALVVTLALTCAAVWFLAPARGKQSCATCPKLVNPQPRIFQEPTEAKVAHVTTTGGAFSLALEFGAPKDRIPPLWVHVDERGLANVTAAKNNFIEPQTRRQTLLWGPVQGGVPVASGGKLWVRFSSADGLSVGVGDNESDIGTTLFRCASYAPLVDAGTVRFSVTGGAKIADCSDEPVSPNPVSEKLRDDVLL